MNLNISNYLAALVLVCLTPNASAQKVENPASDLKPWNLHTSFSLNTDIHYSSEKDLQYRLMGNTFLDMKIRSNYIELGARLEEMSRPLPGREMEKGWGLPHIYMKGTYKGIELTIGDIYEQFGSGMLLYLYEDRSLGIDNALRGAKLNITALKGLYIKALIGQQRKHFDRNWKPFKDSRGYLWGGDLELQLSQWIPELLNHESTFNIGLGFVSKHENENEIFKFVNNHYYHVTQPKNVGAVSGRIHASHGKIDLYSEYAYKYNDPNASNHYTFRPGSSWMTSLTYSKKGLSAMLAARRTDNFDFRSAREATINDLKINYLQPFTLQQSYALAALYPYATQPSGEWALQGDFSYLFPKRTFIGGKYGTSIKLSASYISSLYAHSLNQSPEELLGTYGPKFKFWKFGGRLFHDVTFEINKKFSRTYKLLFSYINQSYNQQKIEGHALHGDIINSDIFIYEGQHKLNRQMNLRMELQYLHTKQAEKDWMFGLAEIALQPHVIFSFSDQYNAGTTKKHYYMASITGILNTHRLQLSYGCTRAGINCSGGICRMMPQTKGAFLSYHYNF